MSTNRGLSPEEIGYSERYPEIFSAYSLDYLKDVMPHDNFFEYMDNNAIEYTPIGEDSAIITFDNGRGVIYSNRTFIPFEINEEGKEIVFLERHYGKEAYLIGKFIQGEDVDSSQEREIVKAHNITFEEVSENVGFFNAGRHISGNEILDVYNQFKNLEDVEFSGNGTAINISWKDGEDIHRIRVEDRRDEALFSHTVIDANGERTTTWDEHFNAKNLLSKLERMGVSMEELDDSADRAQGKLWMREFVEQLSESGDFQHSEDYPGVMLDVNGKARSEDAYFELEDNGVILTRCRITDAFDLDNNPVSNVETFSIEVKFNEDSKEFVISDIYTSDGTAHGYISDTTEMARFSVDEMDKMSEFLDRELSKAFDSDLDLDNGPSIDD